MRLGSPDLNKSFKNSALPNVAGVDSADGQTLAVEFLAADPVLVAGVPRIWVNTATGILKFTHNGTTTKTVTAT